MEELYLFSVPLLGIIKLKEWSVKFKLLLEQSEFTRVTLLKFGDEISECMHESFLLNESEITITLLSSEKLSSGFVSNELESELLYLISFSEGPATECISSSSSSRGIGLGSLVVILLFLL